ncbi:energy-coupling factor ABC transporter ATP-binding protein [Propionibacteriaceae bacterium Y1923]|uniref:energy-coupling factor ABC transporter ATP-binding protein n=1 Tax=Aestuariimicrobium sp. Y1814 TaxID=3418742 RepID=UPI003C171BD0
MIVLHGAGLEVEVAQSGGLTTRTILAPTSIELAERRIAVIGANGSGKSTLLRLLNGLTLPSTGRVTVDEHDTRRDGSAVRRRVGFVFTDPLHQLVMSTPADDVELSLRRSIRHRSERRATALRLLEQRGLGHVAQSSIYDLSGGERQLVSLTAVLAVEPAIIVADEPTTLLDLRNRLQVIDALMALDQQVIIATHDLDFAARTDRVLLVDDGHVVEDGDPARVIARYQAMMGAR